MVRIASILLALGVTAGAAVALRFVDPSQVPDELGFAALNNNPPNVPKGVELYQEALQRDSANPFRWADLGAAFQTAENIPQARYCFRRALELSGEVPQIWLRDANFHFELDESEEGLRSAARVLKVVPDYDPVLFGYFDRFGLSTASVLSQIGDDRRATQAFTSYLIQVRNVDTAIQAWNYAFKKGYTDDKITNSYIDGLLAAHKYPEARRDWAEYLGNARGDYPDRNLLFNAGFEREPSGSAFDWRIQSSPDFETTRDATSPRDGRSSLHIRFYGTSNVSYKNVIQGTILTSGAYVLTAWVRTDGITTNECPHLEVWETEKPPRLIIESHPFCGTTSWAPVTLSFAAPSQENLITVGVVRNPSQKFDNKIDGSFWLDSLKLVRQ